MADPVNMLKIYYKFAKNYIVIVHTWKKDILLV